MKTKVIESRVNGTGRIDYYPTGLTVDEARSLQHTKRLLPGSRISYWLQADSGEKVKICEATMRSNVAREYPEPPSAESIKADLVAQVGKTRKYKVIW